MKLIIPGEPVAKGRPRFSTHNIGGKNITRAVTPEKTVNYEILIKELWAISGQKRLYGPLQATINAYFQMPKSLTKAQREGMLTGLLRPEKRPDTDNLAKIVLDALNTLAYDDDKQIVSLTVNKWYSAEPRVVVEISEAREGIA